MKPSRLAPVLLAPLLVGFALAVRLVLNPFVGVSAPYVTFVLAVAFCAVFGGLAAGLTAMFLGALAAAYFVVPPLHSFAIEGAQNQLTFAGYLLVSITILALIEMQRRQKSRLSAEVDRRQNAEATERALRERFEITLASIGDGVISTDAQGRITFMNEVASSLTGWDMTEASGQLLGEVFNMRSEVTGAILTSQHGRERFIEETTAPIRDSSGRQSGAVLVFKDTSALRERDEAVQRAGRENESLFRTLADSIPQLAWMAHPDGRIFWYNHRWYEYTGTRPEDMEGWGWQSVHDQTRLPEVLREWRNSLETGHPFDMVILLRGADGVFRPFLTRVMPVRDDEGNVLRWFGTNTDITERQKIEDRLRASDERFRHLYDADVVGIICVDAEQVFEANDVFLSMLGYTRDDLLAGRLRWRNLSPAEYQAEDERMFAHILETGSCKPWEKELLHKDGHSVPILAGATLLQPDPPQCLCVILDLTERKQLERRVLEAQKLDSVGLLAGGVAHDFNNMLVGVIGSASLAVDLVPPGGEVADLLDKIIKTGEQLAHLTRQMLAYAGKGRFFIEPLDLSEMAVGMTKLVRTSIPKKIELKMECAAGLPPIEADKGQLQQIFTNLVLNASEAIGDKTGLISVRTGVRDLSETVIRMELENIELEPGRYVYLQVRDDGGGMDAKTRERIFDPFFSTKFAGRGLGLAAVGGVVRSHKGAITVQSAVGAGACFTVFLPAASGAVVRRALAPANEHLRGSGTVLVVDDESVVREMARRTLERYGYKVLLAESGRAAIHLFKRRPEGIEAVVLDLSMPDMGGDEALPQMHGIRPESKFIISSGHSEVETLAFFHGQRIAGYLQKPYTASGLAEAVRKALGTGLSQAGMTIILPTPSA